MRFDEILAGMKDLLTHCSCDSACHNCMKHFRNQHVHGLLDRFAALDLIRWGGESGEIARAFSAEKQWETVRPLCGIIERTGSGISFDGKSINLSHEKRKYRLMVYPSMWREPKQKNTVCVSEALLKYAKPYAVKKILEALVKGE